MDATRPGRAPHLGRASRTGLLRLRAHPREAATGREATPARGRVPRVGGVARAARVGARGRPAAIPDPSAAAHPGRAGRPRYRVPCAGRTATGEIGGRRGGGRRAIMRVTLDPLVARGDYRSCVTVAGGVRGVTISTDVSLARLASEPFNSIRRSIATNKIRSGGLNRTRPSNHWSTGSSNFYRGFFFRSSSAS